jgi:hypothetical protein
MISFIARISPVWFKDKVHEIKDMRQYIDWERNGKPLPPPHRVKQLAIMHYQKKHDISVLVETGTYKGDMVKAQIKNFKTIYSIELGRDLWAKAVKRFEKDKHVNILLGDSGKVLVDLVPEIKERAIFWLDGHYSAGITAKGGKDCPIFEELNEILKSDIKHILLIDDARFFVGVSDYPTIERISEFILSKNKKCTPEIADDIIRIELK